MGKSKLLLSLCVLSVISRTTEGTFFKFSPFLFQAPFSTPQRHHNHLKVFPHSHPFSKTGDLGSFLFLLEFFRTDIRTPQQRQSLPSSSEAGAGGGGKTIPGAGHVSICFAELSARCGVHAVTSKGQGNQWSFTECVIKFSADEEVCGCWGIAKFPLFTVGQSHQPHETQLPHWFHIYLRGLTCTILLSANISSWKFFSSDPKCFIWKF